jgi:hypothetical protein
MAEIGDFEDDDGGPAAEENFGGRASGMALDVAEAFLNDAEESGLEGLRKAGKIGEEIELGVDAAAFAEAEDVFLESRDEAEFVKEGRMQEKGEGADFARHLTHEGAGLEQGFFGGRVQGVDGMANLSEAEVDGENGLSEAVVEFAANAAAFFVLELEELRGELMDSALGILHFSKVGEGKDDAAKRAVGVEFGDGVEKGPEDVLEVRNAVTNHLAIDGLAGGDGASEGARLFGDDGAIFSERDEIEFTSNFANDAVDGEAENF